MGDLNEVRVQELKDDRARRVIISPHSASTVDKENERLTEIFVDNLSRYLTGRPLRNVLEYKLLY